MGLCTPCHEQHPRQRTHGPVRPFIPGRDRHPVRHRDIRSPTEVRGCHHHHAVRISQHPARGGNTNNNQRTLSTLMIYVGAGHHIQPRIQQKRKIFKSDKHHQSETMSHTTIAYATTNRLQIAYSEHSNAGVKSQPPPKIETQIQKDLRRPTNPNSAFQAVSNSRPDTYQSGRSRLPPPQSIRFHSIGRDLQCASID